MVEILELPRKLEIEGICKREEILRKYFLANAEVTDYERGYISVEFINQEIEIKLQGYAADIIAWHIKANNKINEEKPKANKIVQIPYSGNSLATSVAERLGYNMILGRKELEPPPTWKKALPIENVRSFTGEKGVNFVFNGIEEGICYHIIDDCVAEGEIGLRAIKEFREKGAVVNSMSVYFSKLFQPGVSEIKEYTGIEVFSVLEVKEITPEGEIFLAPAQFKK